MRSSPNRSGDPLTPRTCPCGSIRCTRLGYTVRIEPLLGPSACKIRVRVIEEEPPNSTLSSSSRNESTAERVALWLGRGFRAR